MQNVDNGVFQDPEKLKDGKQAAEPLKSEAAEQAEKEWKKDMKEQLADPDRSFGK